MLDKWCEYHIFVPSNNKTPQTAQKNNKMKRIELTQGFYLTQTERSHILHLLNNNIYSGKINRTEYVITEKEKNKYDVLIGKVQYKTGMAGEKSAFMRRMYEIIVK